MGCLGVGEVARGEQLIANQGQEGMGISTMSKRSRISKYVSKKEGLVHARGQNEAKMEARSGLAEESITVVCIHVYIFISHMLSANNSALCLGCK